MPTRKKNDGPFVALHTQVSGRVAAWLIEMKQEGYVTTCTDAVHQGLILLYCKLKNIEQAEEEKEPTDDEGAS
jgi:hypothetical protein